MNRAFKSKTEHILLLLLAAALFVPNVINLFGYSVDSVEAFSVKLANMPLGELLSATAADVHPPLYYLILRAAVLLFGNAGIVYRAVSLLPYLLLIVYAFRFLYRECGAYCTAVFLSCASLTTTALRYNNHIRMYSWCALFLLLSFHAVRRILEENKRRDWIELALFVLLAGYTQYYALVSAALLYLFLLAVLFRKKTPLAARYWLLSAGIVLAGYLPWLMVFLQSVSRTAASHWMPQSESVLHCYKSLFSARFSIVWPTLWLAAVALIVITEKRGTALHRAQGFSEENGSLSAFSLWLLSGVTAILGTMATGYLVSALTRPMFNSRYLYPVSVIAWVSLAAAVEKLKYKRYHVPVFLAVFLVFQTMSCAKALKERIPKDDETRETVELVRSYGVEGMVLLSKGTLGGYDDQVILNMGFATAPTTDYFFRGVRKEQRIDPETPEKWELSPGQRYLLFLHEPLSEEGIRVIEDKGLKAELLTEEGRILSPSYTIYILEEAQTDADEDGR